MCGLIIDVCAALLTSDFCVRDCRIFNFAALASACAFSCLALFFIDFAFAFMRSTDKLVRMRRATVGAPIVSLIICAGQDSSPHQPEWDRGASGIERGDAASALRLAHC